MEAEQTEKEDKALQLKDQSIGLIAILIEPEAAREFERRLTLSKVIESAIPISVVKQAAGLKAVAQALDIHLTRLVVSVNVSQNLNDSQIKIIVEDLLDKYPNESLEDFILVFKKARQGEFGTIYHLHSAVIFEWMAKYLDEKYDVIDKKYEREKGGKCVEPTGDTGEGFKQAAEYAKQLASKAQMPPLTKKEVEEEGQEKPKNVYHRPTKSELAAKDKHFRYISANYDPVTQEKLPDWMEETKWNDLND